MKQLVQKTHGGEAEVIDIPPPELKHNMVLVQNSASLVSVGTERMAVATAKEGLIGKAIARPDIALHIFQKMQKEGLVTTINSVRQRLSDYMALGYSCSGTVIGIDENVKGFKIGDMVACAGAGYAVHAEIVSVPCNLVVKFDERVDFNSAAFTTLGAIGLQGIRLADVKLGEIVAVIGLGLIGQLTVQMLKAAGCLVAGIDIRNDRVEMAKMFGIDGAATTPDEFIAICRNLSEGYGVDSVLITTDTKTSQPVELAGEIVRDKGTVVAVGMVGMEIPRKKYYEKELDFKISRSYGPGRYDPSYEEKGHDYPYGYVRWTERRNMQAFVNLLAEGKVNVHPLITHSFLIDDAPKAYDLITGKTDETFLGIVINYPQNSEIKTIAMQNRNDTTILPQTFSTSEIKSLDSIRLGVIGAGNFAKVTLMPVIKNIKNVRMIGVASARGVNAQTLAKNYGFAYCSTDSNAILNDHDINTVAILTRHDLHAKQVIAALTAGKNVYVEKPLCLTLDELTSIVSTYQEIKEKKNTVPYLMVGFNRRFAPYVKELKSCLDGIKEPLLLTYRVNAGYIPPEHWTQDMEQGGGRLLGEVCHFIDLLIYLSGSSVHRINALSLPDSGRYSQDNLHIIMEFKNGSLGAITYVANGDRSYGKEYLEVFGGGLSARIDDYRSLLIHYGKIKVKRVDRLHQDKGFRSEWFALIDYLTGKLKMPMTFEDIVYSTAVTLTAKKSLIERIPLSME
ncbi:MAG: bi-domain-containing oxidoreductase [Nitrospirota bacterium]